MEMRKAFDLLILGEVTLRRQVVGLGRPNEAGMGAVCLEIAASLCIVAVNSRETA